MNIQIIIVAVIICAAAIYIARQIVLKARSFSNKKSCGSDCGCGTKSKLSEAFVEIK